MSQRLTATSLNEEFASDSQRVMFYGFAVMIATAVAFAVLSAITISKGIMNSSHSVHYLMRLPYWCVSALAVCMVYMKLHTYGRFITHTMTVWDVMIPLSKAIVASAMFAVLNYDDLQTWHFWVLVFSLFAFISHGKIRYYMSRFDENGAPPETARLLRMIKENTKENDLRFTAIFGVFFLVAWVMLNFVPPLPFMARWSTNWQALLAIPAGFGMVMAIHSDKKIRAEIVRLTEVERVNAQNQSGT